MGLALFLCFTLAVPIFRANSEPPKKVESPKLSKEAQEGAQRVLTKAQAATHVSARALSRVIVGRAVCNGPDGSYRTDISSPPGRRFWFRQVHPGNKTFEALVTADGAWSIKSDGSRSPLNYRRTLMVRSHDFQRIALDPESFVSNLGLIGTVNFRGLKSEQLSGLADDGTKIELYYAVKSGLPLGFKMMNPVQAATIVTITYQEWKDVEGVLLPSKVVASDTQGDFYLSFQGLFFDDESR